MLDIAKFLDQTNLKQDAREADIIKLAEEQRKYEFRSICIAPSFLQVARKLAKYLPHYSDIFS